MAVDPAKVRELREKTGLPMMECKRALEASEGDVDKAIEALRKAGAKAQAKLADRKATEGRIAAYRSSDGRVGALVALRCETEPVAKTAQFREFADKLVDVLATHPVQSTEELLEAPFPGGGKVKDALTELVNQLRENISIGAFARLEGDAVVQYVHFDNRKAAMVALKGVEPGEAAETLGKDLCMHVVFHRPRSLSREGLDPEFIAKEREILLEAARNDPKNAKKPPEILEKIVEGQVEKVIKEQCFLEQPFVRNDKITVREFLKQSGTGAEIIDYAYVATDM